MDDRDLRPLFLTPDDVMVLVGGGAGGNFIGMFTGSTLGGGKFVTRKVELPRNWAALVEKYEDIVPVYLPRNFFD